MAPTESESLVLEDLNADLDPDLDPELGDTTYISSQQVTEVARSPDRASISWTGIPVVPGEPNGGSSFSPRHSSEGGSSQAEALPGISISDVDEISWAGVPMVPGEHFEAAALPQVNISGVADISWAGVPVFPGEQFGGLSFRSTQSSGIGLSQAAAVVECNISDVAQAAGEVAIKQGIELIDCIGHGSFACIFLGVRMHTDHINRNCHNDGVGRTVAVKVMKCRGVQSDEAFMLGCLHLLHPNIVQLFGVCDGPTQCLVFEHCRGGDLWTLLHKSVDETFTPIPLTLKQQLSMARDVASALTYIHSEGLIHRDIKSSNCLLAEPVSLWAEAMPQTKLGDFGFACFVESEKLAACVGTLRWMAPEVIAGITYNQSADVYSFGVLLAEILCRQIPYSGHSDQSLMRLGLRTLKSMRPDLSNMPAGCSKELQDLVVACWQNDAAVRPAMVSVLDSLCAHLASVQYSS